MFLTLGCSEALYGGAAGGGKSSALLMAALQHVDVPGYRAYLFRRTFADLALPGALMDRAHDWLAGTAARWNERDKTWTFPSGATLTFGYLEHENDKFRYQGSEAAFLGFDELTQFSESQYRYLFSRRRKTVGQEVPLRTRAASNPGGSGHEWVKQRFLVEGRAKGRVFVPAKLDDNPHLDREGYLAGLQELDPVTRAQLLSGDWSARQEGGFFKREWFRIIDPEAVPAGLSWVRYWDLAATEPAPGKDPDWTAGAKVASKDGQTWIADLRAIRARPQGVEALIKQTAFLDGREVPVWIEQEPGSSGVNTIDHYQRTVLPGFTVRGNRATGSKTTRAAPVSSAAEAGNVFLVRGEWCNDFLDEAEAFPNGAHDDRVDAVSGGFEKAHGGGFFFV